MKKHILFLFLTFLFFYVQGQKVFVTVHQDYTIPDIPLITQIGDTLKSSSPIGNQWYIDDVKLQGETKPTLVVAKTGKYKVMVTYDSGCSSMSSYVDVVTGVSVIQNAEFTCKVFPNPNDGIFTIELESEKSEVFVLELFTAVGKSVVKQSVNHRSGTQQISFGKASISAGIYYLEISYGPNTVSRKIIVK